jgi:hypothetical protein
MQTYLKETRNKNVVQSCIESAPVFTTGRSPQLNLKEKYLIEPIKSTSVGVN